jgi:transcriptional regulator with XRE-family HTH domain
VSRVDLALASGLSKSRIDGLHSGTHPRINSGSAEAIAQHLDVHPEELFSGTPASASTRQATSARQAAIRSQTASRPQATVISRDFLDGVREAAKVSRDDLARAAGWEYAGTVSQLLDGHRATLDAVAAERISQHLGTNAGTFFTTPGSSSTARPSRSGGSTATGAAAGPGSASGAGTSRSGAGTAAGAAADPGSAFGAGPSGFGGGHGCGAAGRSWVRFGVRACPGRVAVRGGGGSSSWGDGDRRWCSTAHVVAGAAEDLGCLGSDFDQGLPHRRSARHRRGWERSSGRADPGSR